MSVVVITSILVAALVSFYYFERKAENIDTDVAFDDGAEASEASADEQVEQN